MRQGKRAQAMALITEVIKSNPTDAEAYMNRGSVQTSLGEVSSLQSATSRRPYVLILI